MKTLFYVLMAALLIAGCKKEEQKKPDPPVTKNVTVFTDNEALYGVWLQTGDLKMDSLAIWDSIPIDIDSMFLTKWTFNDSGKWHQIIDSYLFGEHSAHQDLWTYYKYSNDSLYWAAVTPEYWQFKYQMEIQDSVMAYYYIDLAGHYRINYFKRQ